MVVAQQEVQKMARKAGSQKKNAVARSKGKKGNQSQKTKKNRKKAGFVDTVFPLLIFMVTLVFFLNFAGIINLPFLKPVMSVKSGEGNPVEAVEETPLVSEETPEEEIYPGPDLPRVSQGEEKQSVLPEVEEPLPASQASESALQTGVEDSTPSSESEQENLWRLAKIYTAMEPEEAARLLEKLSDEEVIRIFSVMKERNVAEILSIFPPERGATLIRKMMEGR
ncbi:hypothetical protein QBE54_10190 [Thermatribacter velox]|uniref:Magnesium transporter MgtE intracellular domain-containing protein n=1 Tax=Thermatribacter velox TaxID=3039681 RepID=A0ABZ2YAT5_9BACT